MSGLVCVQRVAATHWSNRSVAPRSLRVLYMMFAILLSLGWLATAAMSLSYVSSRRYTPAVVEALKNLRRVNDQLNP